MNKNVLNSNTFLMKIKFLLFLSITTLWSHAQISKKVLFLGNSYTYYNNLPITLQEMGFSDANDLIIDQNTPGGSTLMAHSSNATSLQKIQANNWDYVVLQDQSQLPSFSWSQVQSDVLPYAEILVDSIRSANECAIPLFFNTWGRENGDPQWDSVNTFEKMNDRLFNTYGLMAETHSGKRAPVGMAFAKVKQDQGNVVTHSQLYTSDGSHPSKLGSYLTACVFYELIFETTVVGNSYLDPAISNAQANYLQTVAHEVNQDIDSITTDFTQPLANFEYQLAGNSIQTINMSEHAFDYQWYFGDGGSSSVENPAHTYVASGTYVIELNANYCSRQATHLDTVDIQISTAQQNLTKTQELTLYPNPSQGAFTVECEAARFDLYSLGGRYLGSYPTGKMNDLMLPAGSYIVSTTHAKKHLIIQH